MNEERCENCRFVLRQEINDALQQDNGNLLCRRYPPIPVSFVDAYEIDKVSGTKKIFTTSSQIGVNHNWWCGEWKPKVTN